VGRAIGGWGWWALRNIGMNYIIFVFALDFIKIQRPTSALNAMEYLPFAVLSVAGPALKLAAWGKRLTARQAPRTTLPLAAGELPGSPPPSTR
jgi:hypothetical protein